MPADPASERAGWLDGDVALLNDADGFRPRVARQDLQIGSRLMPDDPNLLFRWRLPTLNAPATVVFEGFVRRLLDHHQQWTREFVDGRVVDSPAPDTRILQQTFNPGVPGIAKRDVLCVEVVRELDQGAWLASYRSTDCVPCTAGHIRLVWWGAVLCTPLDEGHSELIYLDRENQGGRFPVWLMNRVMPHYLVKQAEHVRRFFADGGPAELRA